VPKLEFEPEVLRRAFAVARIVKPETNDFCLRFTDGGLTIVSQDKRRFVRSEVRPKTVVDGLSTDDFYLTSDRASLFDSDLESVTISVNEKSLTVIASGDGQTRQAVLKRRAERSRRPPIPARPPIDDAHEVDAPAFEELLKQVSCSALVKETKTDEEMRLNQVHFYPDHGCAVSNARFYASYSFLPGLSLDLSIVSADLPMIRQFCSQMKSGGKVLVRQDDRRLYVTDKVTGSVLSMTRVNCGRPPYQFLDESEFNTTVQVRRDVALKGLNWAVTALEGTQRITLDCQASPSGEPSSLTLLSDHTEIAQFKASVISGPGIRADFPARLLHSIFTYVEDGIVELRYGHKQLPTLIQIRHSDQKGPVRSFHFLQSMKARS
jgi:hypothetical protein